MEEKRTGQEVRPGCIFKLGGTVPYRKSNFWEKPEGTTVASHTGIWGERICRGNSR